MSTLHDESWAANWSKVNPTTIVIVLVGTCHGTCDMVFLTCSKLGLQFSRVQRSHISYSYGRTSSRLCVMLLALHSDISFTDSGQRSFGMKLALCKREWAKKYGPRVRALGPIGVERMTFLNPEAMHKILISDSLEYPRVRYLFFALRYAGNSVLTMVSQA